MSGHVEVFGDAPIGNFVAFLNVLLADSNRIAELVGLNLTDLLAIDRIRHRVLLQCDFTGGDGEVDSNILASAILDRQGRGTVEGVVAIVLLGIDCRGVDRDGVALGVGVISGGVAFGAFVSCCLNERTKIPVGGSVGDCRRGHADR